MCFCDTGSRKRRYFSDGRVSYLYFYPGYPLIKRGIYYCSRMISAQYGTEFTNSHYENIKKVYSIWICMNPPKNRENSITRYYIAEENLVGSVKERKADYDLMAAVMICLGKEGDSDTDLLKLLNVLLSTETGSQDKCHILEEDFHIRMTFLQGNSITQNFGWLSKKNVKETLWQLVLRNWTVRLVRVYWNGFRYQRIIADAD